MKWLHTIGSFGLLALTVFSPQIQSAVMTHPAISGAIAAAYAILGQFAPHGDPASGLTQTKIVSGSQSK